MHRSLVVASLLLLATMGSGYAQFGGGSQRPQGEVTISEVAPLSTDEVITIENQTGTTLSRGEASVVPSGKDPLPYTMVLGQMSNGDKRAFYLTSFKNRDGARFIRTQVEGHLVRVTATDSAGKVHEREVPFK